MRALGVNFVAAGRGGRAAHHELAWSIRNRYKIQLSVWDGVRKELASDKTPIQVLSTEAFWYEDPLEVKRQLAWKGEIKIVAYLQRQDRYLRMLHQQTLATGRVVSFADWMGEMGHRGEYLGVLDEWAEQFGRAAIVVRPFEREDSAVDVVKDFFDLFGLDARGAGIKPMARAVQAPPAVEHFLHAADQIGLDAGKLQAALMKRNREYGQGGDTMRPGEARALMARYGEGNRALAARYWRGDEGPLFPALSDLPPPGGFGIDDPAFAALTVDVLHAVVELVGAQASGGQPRKQLSPKPA